MLPHKKNANKNHLVAQFVSKEMILTCHLLQSCLTASRCHCVSVSRAGETHAVCSRVRSSRGCTCTCTGLRCDSYTSWDNRGPSAQTNRLQTPERQSSSRSRTHAPSHTNSMASRTLLCVHEPHNTEPSEEMPKYLHTCVEDHVVAHERRCSWNWGNRCIESRQGDDEQCHIHLIAPFRGFFN